MALSEAEVAHLKKSHQQFVVQMVAFDPVVWSFTQPTAEDIDWKPFTLISPRYAHTTIGGTVTLYATDSYVRPTTAATNHTFAKNSGVGSVVDNADGTATVTAGDGICVIECASDGNGNTTTAYAYVHGGATGSATAYVAEIRGLSGNLDNGDWQGEMVLRGAHAAIFGVYHGWDQPILMHVVHTWDAVAATFGGYKRHENTFILIGQGAEVFESKGNYYTVVKLTTPIAVLKRMYLEEMKFDKDNDPGGYIAGTYGVADLTPTDVAYYLLSEACNYGEEFNVSLWNNSSTISNFNVRPNASLWEVVKECHEYNFSILYMNRWSNLNGKPSPRVRNTEWMIIASAVYADGASTGLTDDACLDFKVLWRHGTNSDLNKLLSMQAITPKLAIIESTKDSLTTLGDSIEINSLIAKDSDQLDDWLTEYQRHLNRPYDLELTLAMGHELNPGDLFYTHEMLHTHLGADAISGEEWLVTDIDYRFDFKRGFWTRKLLCENIIPTPS